MKCLFFAVPILFLAVTAHSQITIDDILGHNPPVGVDTNYYPFYNGVQMIEIDNVGSWERDVAWHEAMQPRALSWSMLIPSTGPNIYLFRDQSGKIVKAFNTKVSTEQLTKDFRKIPIKQKSQNLSHQLMGGFHTGKYQSELYSYQSRCLEFHGLYKVYNMDSVLLVDKILGGSFFDGKVGLIDSLGNIFLPWEYDNIIPAGKNIVTRKGSECMMIDRNKKSALNGEYTGVNENYLDEFIFYRSEKIAALYYPKEDSTYYINEYDWIDFESMHYVINNSYSWKQPFLFTYKKDGLIGFINERYEEITPPKYDAFYWFTEERGLVVRNGKFGYIDTLANEVIPCRYDYAERFLSGTASVNLHGKQLCIDKNGSEVKEGCLQPEKERGEKVSVGNKIIVRTNTGCGIKDRSGRFVVPPIYQDIQLIQYIENGKRVNSIAYFKARKGSKYGVIDSAGNVLLPFEYELIADYGSRTGFRSLKEDDRHWGIVDGSWKIIVPCIYNGISCGYDSDHFTFIEGVKHGVMDTTGKILIPAIYNTIVRTDDSNFFAWKDTLCGILDRSGNIIIPFEYTGLHGKLYNGLRGFRQHGKWGYMDSTGKVVIAPVYEDVRRFEYTITGVCKNGKWGFIDLSGKLVVDYQYEFVGHTWYKDGTVMVRKNDKIGFVDSSGKEVIPCEYNDEWGFGPDNGHLLEKDGRREWVKAK